MSDHHCDCGHEHCQKLVPPPKASTYPLTMENLVKGVKNINAIIDLIDTRKDENREQMMIFIKIFCDDLVYRFKKKVINNFNTKDRLNYNDNSQMIFNFANNINYKNDYKYIRKDKDVEVNKREINIIPYHK